MARRGKVNEIKVDLANYSYIVNGVAGVGKTTLAYELGKKLTGSNEGTFIISVGEEPTPDHVNGALYDKAPDWAELKDITDDLIDNKQEYPHTRFVAVDSMDELYRIAENEVIRLHNKKTPDDKVETIKQAFKGFQAGENKVVDMVVSWFGSLRTAGYSVLFIGHTKQKNKKDIIQDVEFAQYTNKLDTKYYDAIKDKVNLACVAYNEMEIDDIKEVKDAFTKGKKKKGNLIGSKRVIIFRDDDNAVDTKSHFKHIVGKVDFSVDNFIEAVTNAIKAELEEVKGVPVTVDELNKLAEQQRVEKEKATVEPPKEEENEVSNSALVKKIQESVNGGTMDMKQMQKLMKEHSIKNFADVDSLPTEGLVAIVALIK